MKQTLILLLLSSVTAWATTPSPVGKWKTIDDHTNKPKSIVEISQEGDHLIGKILEVFPQPDKPPHPLCEKCEGDKKNKPVEGLTILWDMQKDDDDALRWRGGHVMDPENGETYRCKLRLSEDGKTLNVRGYLGISLFGRSQDWLRQD